MVYTILGNLDSVTDREAPASGLAADVPTGHAAHLCDSDQDHRTWAWAIIHVIVTLTTLTGEQSDTHPGTSDPSDHSTSLLGI
jgi:hypothetical protein